MKGWIFHENKGTHKWFGRWVGDSPLPPGLAVEQIGFCKHAIEIPGCSYEIGFYLDSKGKHQIFYDSWHSGGLDVTLGEDGHVLTDAYDVAKTVIWAEEKSYDWTLEIMETGATKITMAVNEWGGGGW